MGQGKIHLSVKSISKVERVVKYISKFICKYIFCTGFIIKLKLSSKWHSVKRFGSSELYFASLHKSANIVAFGKPSVNILPILKPNFLVYMILFVLFIFSFLFYPYFFVLLQTLLIVLL